MTGDFRRENDRSRERLSELITEAASADDGTRASTAAVLCHLAFWDSYYGERWRLRLSGDRTAHVALGSQVHSITV